VPFSQKNINLAGVGIMFFRLGDMKAGNITTGRGVRIMKAGNTTTGRGVRIMDTGSRDRDCSSNLFQVPLKRFIHTLND
jgi:hypothetical protein